MRKNQPFLRKATDGELEGIFVRLTPTEKKLYLEMGSPSEKPKTEKKQPSKSSREKPKQVRETKAKIIDDFINDEVEESSYDTGSEDISLVSESELEEEPEEVEKVKKAKKSKKDKQSSIPKESLAPQSSSANTAVKKFTWT